VNAHVTRFGEDIERATKRLVANQQIGDCPTVQAYLALYGGIALMRNGIEALECVQPANEREAL